MKKFVRHASRETMATGSQILRHARHAVPVQSTTFNIHFSNQVRLERVVLLSMNSQDDEEWLGFKKLRKDRRRMQKAGRLVLDQRLRAGF